MIKVKPHSCMKPLTVSCCLWAHITLEALAYDRSPHKIDLIQLPVPHTNVFSPLTIKGPVTHG